MLVEVVVSGSVDVGGPVVDGSSVDVRSGTCGSMFSGAETRGAVDGVAAEARMVETVREGRSVTWSRTSPTAWEASTTARSVATNQAATNPRRRVLMGAVSLPARPGSGNSRLRLR